MNSKRALGPCPHEFSFPFKIPYTGTVFHTLQSIFMHTLSFGAQNDFPEICTKVLIYKGEIRHKDSGRISDLPPSPEFLILVIEGLGALRGSNLIQVNSLF